MAAILAALATEGRGLRCTTLARSLGRDVSAIWRSLQRLSDKGHVRKEGQRYALAREDAKAWADKRGSI